MLLSGNTISGTVFDDLNANGVKDPGEPGIAGIVVSLNALFGPTPTLLTTTSDGSGAYSFTNLVDGTYSPIFSVANRKVTSTGAALPFISVSGGQVVNADLGMTTFAKSPLLDATFGVQGVAGDSVNIYPSGITRQSDGKLVIVGNHSIYRLTADGAPDPTFNGGVPQLSLDIDSTCGVAVQSNGKIDVAGGSRVLQYNADGTVDKTFGTNGLAKYSFGASTYFQGNTEVGLEARAFPEQSLTTPIQMPRWNLPKKALPAGRCTSTRTRTASSIPASGRPSPQATAHIHLRILPPVPTALPSSFRPAGGGRLRRPASST